MISAATASKSSFLDKNDVLPSKLPFIYLISLSIRLL
jgi:hypothetical protein